MRLILNAWKKKLVRNDLFAKSPYYYYKDNKGIMRLAFLSVPQYKRRWFNTLFDYWHKKENGEEIYLLYFRRWAMKIYRQPIWEEVRIIVELLSQHHINKSEAIERILFAIAEATEEERKIIKDCNASYQEIKMKLDLGN